MLFMQIATNNGGDIHWSAGVQTLPG